MQVFCDPSTGCLSKVQAEVEAIRLVHLTQASLHALHRLHQLLCRRCRKRRQRVAVLIRHHQNVTGSIRKSVEADKARLPSLHQEDRPLRLLGSHPISNRKVYRGNHVAEDAPLVLIHRPRSQALRNALAAPHRIRGGNVAISPRSPQPVHTGEYSGHHHNPCILCPLCPSIVTPAPQTPVTIPGDSTLAVAFVVTCSSPRHHKNTSSRPERSGVERPPVFRLCFCRCPFLSLTSYLAHKSPISTPLSRTLKLFFTLLLSKIACQAPKRIKNRATHSKQTR